MSGVGQKQGQIQPLALQASHEATQVELPGAGRISKLRSTEDNYSQNKTQASQINIYTGSAHRSDDGTEEERLSPSTNIIPQVLLFSYIRCSA